MILRKSFVLCALVFFMPLSAWSMDFAVGVKGGIGFPFFTGSDYQEFLDFGTSQVVEYGTYYRTRFMFSYTLGVSVEAGFFSFLSVQPEVMFSWGGGAYGFPENYYLYSYTEFVRTTYIELPVLLKIRINADAGSSYWRRFTLFAGPGIAFKLSDGKVKSRVDGQENSSEKLSSNFLTDRYYFLLFGLGYERARRSPGAFTSFELRYHMGIESVIHPDSGIDDFNENSIQFVIGFSFGTGPR
jgi:hypothetical protein